MIFVMEDYMKREIMNRFAPPEGNSIVFDIPDMYVCELF